MPDRAPYGTQSIVRALAVLKTLATRPRAGWKLVDLARACELDTGTVHRMLASLRSERMVGKTKDGKRYVPGPALFELGLAHPDTMALRDACRAPLADVAQAFGAVGTVWLRSGADVVCADHVGDAGTRVFVETGSRRPLASMAPGLSILMTLAPSERRALIAENLPRMDVLFPGRRQDFLKMIDRSERTGYGISYSDVGVGIYSVGAPLCTAGEPARGALCLIGRTEAFPGTAIGRVARQLARVAARISAAHPGLLAD